PNTQGLPKTTPRPTQMPVVAAHVQGMNVQAKGQQRDASSPFNIIDQMKKTKCKHINVGITIHPRPKRFATSCHEGLVNFKSTSPNARE
ncbi:hypothetical protein KI387_022472, partial [Taxus chinensis]